MSSQPRYVARAEAVVGWRIWDRRMRRWWGNFFPHYPEAVLRELNGLARNEVLAQLCRVAPERLLLKVARGYETSTIMLVVDHAVQHYPTLLETTHIP